MSDAPTILPALTWSRVFPWFRDVMGDDDDWYNGHVSDKPDLEVTRLADAAVTQLDSETIGQLFPTVARIKHLADLEWPKHRLLNALHRGGCFSGVDLSREVIAEMLTWESVGPIIVKQILEVLAFEEIRAFGRLASSRSASF